MHTLIIKTDTAANGNKVADFLRSIEYIKSVEIEDPLTPLTDNDWVRPGRPATQEEHELLCKEMEKDEGGFTTEEAKAITLEEIKQWRKKKQR